MGRGIFMTNARFPLAIKRFRSSDIFIDNPTATVAGNQHWGHATSRDLYTWENQKLAIFATEDSQIFSGSAVIDVNNTSGFFPNQTQWSSCNIYP